MSTVLERNTVEAMEKEKHNAMIGERYRKLLSAVEDQHSTEMPVTTSERAYSPAYTVEAPSYTPIDDTPVLEQIPEVKEYTPSALASSVFTTEKFERMVGGEAVDTFKPTYVAPVKPKTVSEVHYSLTPLAKIAMVAFTAVVTIMLACIGANTQTIRTKSLRLKNLEEQKQELIERNEEIQRRIAELQTEESIIERATEAGLLN